MNTKHLFSFLCALVSLPMMAGEVTMRLPLMNGNEAADSIDVTFSCDPYSGEAYITSSSFPQGGSGVLTIPANIEESGTLYPVTRINQEVFRERYVITGVVLPPTLKEIGISAFLNCSALQSVNWEDLTQLNYIYTSAFMGTGLLRVVIPASLQHLASNAFGGCAQLAEVDFGETQLQMIESYVFYGCALQGELHIPGSVYQIQSHAFENNTGLTSVYLPESLDYLYSGAFRGCNNVTDVYFLKQGESTQWLNDSKDFGTGSNYNCSVRIHVSRNVLDECMAGTRTDNFKRWYEACPDALEASLPIGPGYDAGVLEAELRDEAGAVSGSVRVPMTIESAEEGARTMRIGRYIESSLTGTGVLDLPDSVTFKGERYAVASIEEEAFANCTAVTGIRFPVSLKKIGIDAFKNCAISGRLVFPEGMTYIAGFGMDMTEREADFEALPHITSVVLPSTVDTIGYNAFASNEIDTLVIPASCRYIGGYAFYNSNNLRSITFEGNNLHYIGGYAFAGHWRVNAGYDTNEIRRSMKVKTVTLPEGLERIDAYAFYENDSLETVVLPSTLRQIEKQAFRATPALAAVILPENASLAYIGDDAFASANLSLSSLRLPETLTNIGDRVFRGSSPKELFIPRSIVMTGSEPWEDISFERLIFEDGYRFAYRTTMGGYHYASDTLPTDIFAGSGNKEGSTIVLPEGLICLANSAFNNARIDSVYLPSTLREIGDYAFAGVGLKRPLHIPESVRIIGQHAFIRNMDEAKAYFHQTHPDSVVWRSPDGNDFGTPAKTTIYVNRAIYNQCKAGVREDAFQYWFSFGDGGSLQKIPEPDQETEVIPQPAPTQEEPTEVLQLDNYASATGAVDNYALENTVVDNVLYNLLPDEGDGIVMEEQEEQQEFVPVLQIASTMPMELFLSAVANCIPGSAEWADQFSGISFMIPAGEGTMTLDLKVTGDFKLVVYVGSACTILTSNEQGTVNIDYHCTEDTWVHLFGSNENPNPQQSVAARLRAAQEPEHYARIRSIGIGPKQSHEGTEFVAPESTDSRKIIRQDNHVYIIRNGEKYDLIGRKL